uniref:Coiled-coil domain containing 160 n=1 Tax=Astyanax mexicanus TaxID=7994 RepID=A0A3B1K8C9_ASTMX
MEIPENRSMKESEDVDHHWVETLFPPRFTFQDLLEGKCHSTEEPRISSRRQIYLDVLREVQEQEEKTRRSNLAKRIIREDQSKSNVEENKESGKILNAWTYGEISVGETCIWNEADINKLRAALTELQRDRWRLREQLRSSEERLKTEREERKRLQRLLEECEEQLSFSRKETARYSLAVKSLKTEVYQKDTQLQKFSKQIQENSDEVDGLRAELRRTRDEYRLIKQESSDLGWELERMKEQQKIEGARQAEEARLQNQAATEKLLKELQEAQVELRTEKERHRLTLTALELLRRHFSNL